MIKRTIISKLKEGRIIYGFYLCNFKNIKYSKNEKIFLDITLSDHSGVINAKLWENVNLFSKRFNAGDFVAVKGKPLTYYNKIYINIFSIKRAEKHIFSDYGFQSFIKNNDHKKIL